MNIAPAIPNTTDPNGGYGPKVSILRTLNAISMMKAVTAPMIDPSDMYFVRNPMPRTHAPPSAAAGQYNADRPPISVATPRPPLNLRHTDQLCPPIAAAAASA